MQPLRPAPRPQRRRPEVYRRRRVTVALAAAALLLVPFRFVGGSGGDRGEERTGPSAREQAGADRATSDGEAAAEGGCRNLSQLPLRSRLRLLLMVGVRGDDPAEVEALLTPEQRPGGIFVRGRSALFEARVFTDREDDGLPLIVALDDEGGRVQPLEGVLEDLPSAAAMATTSVAEVEALARDRGEQLVGLGINTVFAPVVDVGGGAGIGDRSFGDTPEVVTAFAGAYARGLRSAGLLPVLKHFPGHGRASADSHDGPSTTPALDSLRALDLRPYEVLVAEGPAGVMIGHLDVPGLTPEGVPASLSPDAVGLLRAGYEFDGLVVTDDIAAMPAVRTRFTPPDAAERALAAGVDLVLLSQPADIEAVLDRLVDAVEQGRLPERRVASALERVGAAGGCA